MTSVQLNTLERDVELARAKFSHDVARLRDPANFTALKNDLVEEAKQTKDELLEKAKHAAQDGIQSFVQQVTAKAIANPAATAAIGAGLAWRLVHRPPIASILVGIGLVSLLRTTPKSAPYMGIYDEDPVARNYGKTVGAQLADAADSAKSSVQDLVGDVRAGLRDGVENLQQGAANVADEARQMADRVSSGATAVTQQVATQASAAAEQVVSAVQDALPDEETRNNLLLGAAALAVAAAVGIAYQRRSDAAPGAD